MIRALIDAANSVQSQVWQIIQFSVLVVLVIYGGHLLTTGHGEIGMAIVTGSFALLRFEVAGGRDHQ